jgi:hypothetical protein
MVGRHRLIIRILKILDPENNSIISKKNDQFKINMREAKLSCQQQTVLNLYNCGITPDMM